MNMKNELKFLLFDQSAIQSLVGNPFLQSVDYNQGMRLVNHICGRCSSEIFESVAVEHLDDGVLFVGKRHQDQKEGHFLFCVDLTQCKFGNDIYNMVDMLTIFQRCFRTSLKIWNRQPFSFSERYNETKSIIFPFMLHDNRRIVIERSNVIPRLTKRNIIQPLLAYKYSSEDPHGEDKVDTTVLEKACECYYKMHYSLQNKIAEDEKERLSNEQEYAITQIRAKKLQSQREDFVFWDFDTQYDNLTVPQREIVDVTSDGTPIRIDGAAGTGKTVALVMRAYKLLLQHYKDEQPYHIVFFTHSESICNSSKEMFAHYALADRFMSKSSPQHIEFTSLFSYCAHKARIPVASLLETDAGDAKTYQLMIVESVVQNAYSENMIQSHLPLLSPKIKDLFSGSTPVNLLCMLLQHEFSIQIKGRTDCTFDKYRDLPSIENGLPCTNANDKELVFALFNRYQAYLNEQNSYDVDDVILEALSKLNAPVWRRERQVAGYNYIIVDEMHLFSFNEQNVFHYLTKNKDQEKIPICFALDYSQAIGDRGNTKQDYTGYAFGEPYERSFNTVFRSAPQIANFCSAIAASGTLMFQGNFVNPYQKAQSPFTDEEERKFSVPTLTMCTNDDNMIDCLGKSIDTCMRELNCKKKDIAIITFEADWASESGASMLSQKLGKKIAFVANKTSITEDCFLLLSPYSVNGLEFQAVILLGVDEGRIPQKSGTNDILQHFVKYNAYNMLYLSASRAKYKLVLLSNEVYGRSSCLEHAVEAQFLEV